MVGRNPRFSCSTPRHQRQLQRSIPPPSSARRRVPRPGTRPSTNHVLPEPASRGRYPAASPRRSRHSASRGSTSSAAGSRSLPWSPDRAAELVPPRGRPPGCEHAERRRQQGEGAGLGTAAARPPRRCPVTRARPPTRQNATSAPMRGRGRRGRSSPPSAARRPRRPSRRPARRRPGCACARRDPGRPPGERQRPRHQVVVAAGRRRAVGQRSPRSPVRVELEPVGQVEGDHLGVDQVEAVVPDTGDPQRER